MTAYILIPGSWLGAWAWRPVTDRLRAHGHDVYPLSLTGLGERVHLGRPDTDLDTHVTDVLNLMRYEDLHDVALVGHSYAGTVITAAADRAPDRVGRLVYVDTGPLPDGVAQADFGGPGERARSQARVDAEGDGWRLPPPQWTELAAGVSDVDDDALAALKARAAPHPWPAAIQPVRLTGAWEGLPRLGILSSFTTEQARGMAAAMPMMRHMADDNWTFAELPTWHWPMFSRPDELADLLHHKS
jgi:pimeloyl-ACP methyl ester carboxylesterase